MTGILADVNIQGHVDFLFDLLTSAAWTEFWQALGIRYSAFGDIGRIDRQYAERVVASLLEILLDIDLFRGAGRLYLP